MILHLASSLPPTRGRVPGSKAEPVQVGNTLAVEIHPEFPDEPKKAPAKSKQGPLLPIPGKGRFSQGSPFARRCTGTAARETAGR